MPRRPADVRFDLVAPTPPRRRRPRRRSPAPPPQIVPLRVLPSTAPVARWDGESSPAFVEVALLDGTMLRLPAALGAGCIVELLAGLRSRAC